jgi:hypothetical protein
MSTVTPLTYATTTAKLKDAIRGPLSTLTTALSNSKSNDADKVEFTLGQVKGFLGTLGDTDLTTHTATITGAGGRSVKDAWIKEHGPLAGIMTALTGGTGFGLWKVNENVNKAAEATAALAKKTPSTMAIAGIVVGITAIGGILRSLAPKTEKAVAKETTTLRRQQQAI